MEKSPLKSWISNTIIFLISSLILVPLLLSIIIPVIILRLFSSLSSKCHPSIGRLLSPTSSYFAVDDLYNHPVCTLITVFTIEGKIDRKALMGVFEDFSKLNKYPELKQTLSRWMGFFCWRNVDNFSLLEHIKFVEDPVDHQEMLRIRKSLVKKPFQEGKPLWELITYENYSPQAPEIGIRYSTIVFRVHHSLADGYSLLNLFNNFEDSKSIYAHLAKPDFLKRSIFGEIAFWTRLILLGPFQLVRTLIDSKDQNSWRVPLEKIQGSVNTSESKEMALGDLKKIAESRGVRTSALIFAAFTGAIRNHMISYGSPVPDKFTIVCPFPLPSHPGHLTNKMTVVPVPAPVWEINPLERLKRVNENFEDLKTSTIPYVFAGLINFSGLIVSLTQFRRKSALGTFVMTNFPGPPTAGKFFGLKVSDINFSAELQNKSIAAGGYSLSYNGKLILGIVADSCLFPNDKMMEEFLKLVLEEFEIFRNGGQQEMV